MVERFEDLNFFNVVVIRIIKDVVCILFICLKKEIVR